VEEYFTIILATLQSMYKPEKIQLEEYNFIIILDLGGLICAQN
jgi:hypothetical protein